MKYMLDTNICSYIIKHRPIQFLQKFKKLPSNACCISSVTHAELRYWVSKNYLLHKKSKNASQPKINENIIEDFVSRLTVEAFDSNAAKAYGEIRAFLESKGRLIGSEDLFIGAHALGLNRVLVTNNIKEFKRIPGLNLENWIH